MGELKFDLSSITPDRLYKILGEDLHDRAKNIEYLSYPDVALLRKEYVDKMLEEMTCLDVKKFFLDKIAPKIVKTHNSKSQKFKFTFPRPVDEDAAFNESTVKKYFRIFHLSAETVKMREGNVAIQCEVSSKLNNPTLYPELAASPLRTEGSIDLKEFNEFREQGHFCDVTVRVNGRDFQAHKMVLSAFSGYFKAYFVTTLKEAGTNLIDLSHEGISDAVFEKLLHYMYGQKVSLKTLSLDDLISLALFANKIHANGLYKLCQSKIIGKMSQENFQDVLDFTALIDRPEMLQACKRFVYFNPTWADEQDLSWANAEQLIHFKKIVTFLGTEKIEKRIVQELKHKLDSANFALVAASAKDFAASGDKELKKHCKRYWSEHKVELLDNPVAKKARLTLSDIE